MVSLAEFLTKSEPAKAEGISKYAQNVLPYYEKALGLDHPSIATSLDDYATLLRMEAVKMETRARAIRIKHAQDKAAKAA